MGRLFAAEEWQSWPPELKPENPVGRWRFLETILPEARKEHCPKIIAATKRVSTHLFFSYTLLQWNGTEWMDQESNPVCDGDFDYFAYINTPSTAKR
jgi:hypothetical protein